MQTFLGVPRIALAEVQSGQVVVMSAAHCTPYAPGKPSHSADAPAAIRSASAKFAAWHDHFDFDTGAALLPDGAELVDAGEIACQPDELSPNLGDGLMDQAASV